MENRKKLKIFEIKQKKTEELLEKAFLFVSPLLTRLFLVAKMMGVGDVTELLS